MKEYRFEVEFNEDIRLDLFLVDEMEDLSRNYIQGLIEDNLVYVNGKNEKSNYIVKEGDNIILHKPSDKIELKKEDLNINIIYEDDSIALVEKPIGMLVHPAPGNKENTLVNGLLYQIDSLSDKGEDFRPGIVHRLDKDTSGILVVAKNNHAYTFLIDQFVNRSVKREYICLVHGNISEDEFTIDAPIGRNVNDRRKMAVTELNSKESITDFKVVKRYEDYTLLTANLTTGRMHQIRVHLSHINHPIVGDKKYSNRKIDHKLNGQLLHARKLGFIHPDTKKYVEYETEVPERFVKFIENK